MPGRRITAQQKELYMTARQQGAIQQLAAAQAGFSERSGRSLEKRKPSSDGDGPGGPRGYRTRADPFEAIWASEVVPLLEESPGLQATTVMRDLQERYPGRYGDGLLRTLQRRVRQWRASAGPEREVFFPQTVEPGWQMLCDFTVMDALGVSIDGEPLPHRLAHVRLRYSGWAHATVVLGGESFPALATALTQALEVFGGVPQTLRTDSLSAAFANRDTDTDDDARSAYAQFCAHYGLKPTRNNRGLCHENGGIESPNGHLKTAIDQALLLRGSRDFSSLDDYRNFIATHIAKANARRSAAIKREQPHLRPLPGHAAPSYSVRSARVSSHSTIDVLRCTYRVPNRLRGYQLTVHVYDDSIICFVGIEQVYRAQRKRGKRANERAYVIDYRHVVTSLVRKPGAFRQLSYRDALHPSTVFRQAWERIDREQPHALAPRRYLEFLRLAAVHGEPAISDWLSTALGCPQHLDPARCETSLNTHRLAATDAPAVQISSHDLSNYDHLIPASSHTENAP